MIIKASRLKYLICFGRTSFIPLMNYIQTTIPAWLFTKLAYQMFFYLFGWSDTRWDKLYKNAYFRFTPRPVSSRVILQWTDVAKRKRLLPLQRDDLVPLMRSREIFPSAESPGLIVTTSNNSLASSGSSSPYPQSGHEYDLSQIKVPMVVIHGTRDELVNACHLIEQISEVLALEKSIEGYEHLDFIWAKDAKQQCWDDMVEALKKIPN